MPEPTPNPIPPAKPVGPKPGPFSPASVESGAAAHTDTKGDNPLPVDSAGRSLEVGDSVNLTATVTSVADDGKINLEISHPKVEGKWSVTSVDAGVVTHTGLNPRIGAAPQLRTPVVEVPAEQGGVKPVPKDEFEAGRTESSAGLPSATEKKASTITAA